LGTSAAATAAEVSTVASNSGTYLVVAGDGNGALSGSGTYRLTLGETGIAAFASVGDTGGAMTGALTYDGTIDVGDLDVLTFTACAGDLINLSMQELTNGSSLTPWIRLYGRDGTLLNTVFSLTNAIVSRVVPLTGSYTLVLGDNSGGFSGSSTYRLTANGLSTGLKLCNPIVAGTNATISGVGARPGAGYILYTSTNVDTPRPWPVLNTNVFDQWGVFFYTNLFNPAEQKRFFDLFEQ
jgi:hypothetical protein